MAVLTITMPPLAEVKGKRGVGATRSYMHQHRAPHWTARTPQLGCGCSCSWGNCHQRPDQAPLKSLAWLLVQVRLHQRLGHLADIYDGLHPGRSWFSQLSLTPRGSFP